MIYAHISSALSMFVVNIRHYIMMLEATVSTSVSYAAIGFKYPLPFYVRSKHSTSTMMMLEATAVDQ